MNQSCTGNINPTTKAIKDMVNDLPEIKSEPLNINWDEVHERLYGYVRGS